ncbi:unnamed protein product, partial [Trichobilharzia szidati]
LQISLAVDIIFAVITNIVISILCGMVTTCFEVKWCLTSLALDTVFATLIFLTAIYSKSFTLLSYKFSFVFSGIMGSIFIILVIFSVIQSHLEIATKLLLGCVILLLAIVSYCD